jgi:transposase
VVYVDECGVNTFMTRLFGRAPRGERLNIFLPGRRFKRMNIVAAQHGKTKKIIAPYFYDWSMNSAFFLVWFTYFLLPALDPGTIIVMDNARFHPREKLFELAKIYNCRVVFQPKYSPDLNPIEKLWANLKNWLRLHATAFPRIQDAMKAYFQCD